MSSFGLLMFILGLVALSVSLAVALVFMVIALFHVSLVWGFFGLYIAWRAWRAIVHIDLRNGFKIDIKL